MGLFGQEPLKVNQTFLKSPVFLSIITFNINPNFGILKVAIRQRDFIEISNIIYNEKLSYSLHLWVRELTSAH